MLLIKLALVIVNMFHNVEVFPGYEYDDGDMHVVITDTVIVTL